jgi:enamine deaminase RidA (YjgF/YER057c/UK114 family)
MAELGYTYEPAALEKLTFHSATKVGNLIFTSGQIPLLGDTVIKGKVGSDVDVETAKKAAEICAFNCFRAAGAVVDIESITRVVKVFGMVNVSDDFDNTSEVIHGASEFVQKIFGENGGHARSAVGMVLPSNFSVEVEMILTVE